MDLGHWLLCKYRRAAMNREKCINRNITIASAIISGVNILTFYNAFYKCFKVKLVDCLEKCLIYGHIRRFAD